MTPTPDHIDNAIAGYLSGEASADQRSFVEQWRAESERNRKYFEHLKLIFEQTASANAGQPFDTDRAWENVRTKLSDGSVREAKTIPLKPDYKMFMRIAAGLVVLLATGLFAINFFHPDDAASLELASGVHIASDTLPDGTAVHLNRETKIEYALDTDNNMHVAKLAGEAYFTINHADDKTFIVEAEGTFIKDIGTSFNVKAYPGSPTIEVVVEEGEVWFYTDDDPGVHLKANGKGIYNRTTRTFSVSEPEPNVTSYKTKFFSFSNQSLSVLVETVNKVYDTKIRIDDNLRHCKLTVSFSDEAPEEIASVIAETLGLTASRAGHVINLKGPGCGETTP